MNNQASEWVETASIWEIWGKYMLFQNQDMISAYAVGRAPLNSY